MMTRKLTYWVGRSLRVLTLGLGLALASHPLAAMEELTVNGAKAAAQVRAQRARFESEMETYRETVGAEYRGFVKEQLKQAMRDETRLAAIDVRGRSRG